MTVIEGVGDEVTIVAAILTLLFVIIATFLYRNLLFEELPNVTRIWEQYFLGRQVRNVNVPDGIAAVTERPAINLIHEPNSSHYDSNRNISESTVSNELLVQNSEDTVSETVTEEETASEVQPEINSTDADVVSESDKEGPITEDGHATQETQSENELESNETPINNTTNEENVESLPLNTIRVRLKYLNDTERIVTAKLTETIGTFKRTQFSEDLRANKTVRLIFNGQLLRDEATMQNYRIEDRTVLHVHISQTQPPQNLSSHTHSDLDVSGLMWPLLSVILGICWVMYIRYPEFFTVTSVVLLIAFSASFLLVYVHIQVQAP